MSILFAYISSSSFIFQTIYQLDERSFSIIFAINAAGLIIGSSLNGILSKRINFIKIANVAAIILTIVCTIIMIILLTSHTLSYMILVGFIFSILFLIGFINPNATAASLAPFTHNAGAASALGGAIRMGTGAVIAALIGIFQTNSSNTMFITMLLLAIFTFILLKLVQPKKGSIQ